MDPKQPFSTFQDEAFTALKDTTKAAAGLAAEDLSFHRSFDSQFASSLDRCSSAMLGLINSLLRNATVGMDLDAPKLNDVEDIDTHWKDVVEVVDFLLEKADTCLDEYTGAIKQKNPEPLPGARRDDTTGTNNMFKNRNLPKPQLNFRVPVNNHDNSPFKPLLISKPHAKVPLAQSIRTFMDDKLQMQYYHPYKMEIEQLEYPKDIFVSKPPIDYMPFESTQPVYVDTEQSLAVMLKELKQAKEIAIDLEHHNERSFIGFVCLMQISTRQKDWIVDTLKLREELQVLNEVFGDPNILKVLHGASMDIIWLQRDFGLYIVGLFDTYEAARSLGFASKGLAFLLKKYVDFDAEKKYQLADWRIRPLPQEMLEYARSDTHFLLYCFDKLRNELLERTTPEVNLMSEVLQNSKETSLRRYEREGYDMSEGSGQFGWALMLKRTPAMFTPEQFEVFKAIHQWRDQVARDEDDSHHYVMPKHQLYSLARLMPEDVPGVLGTCHPASPHVRARVGELVTLIKSAKETAPKQPAVPQVMETVPVETPAAEKLTLKEPTNIFEISEIPVPPRSIQSNFWGKAVGSSKWLSETARLGKVLSEVRLAVPLPPLTAAIYLNPDDVATEASSTAASSLPQEPGSRVEHEFTRNKPKQESDNIIIVKQVGGARKRKRDTNEMDETTLGPRNSIASPSVKVKPDQVDEDTTVLQQDLEAEEDALKDPVKPPSSEKEHKRKRKKAKDGGEESTSGSASAAEQKLFEPFDYSKAPSVLKPDEKRREEKGGRVFNPYGKPGAGGPKALRKARKEKEGRSAIFKK
ncbi:ribonuclease H-like domain-containing protein [Kalaharituber pfeilii]|nr:ribonuclease H-like domain-containing protein [Kalaharituber pfeilii]